MGHKEGVTELGTAAPSARQPLAAAPRQCQQERSPRQAAPPRPGPRGKPVLRSVPITPGHVSSAAPPGSRGRHVPFSSESPGAQGQDTSSDVSLFLARRDHREGNAACSAQGRVWALSHPGCTVGGPALARLAVLTSICVRQLSSPQKAQIACPCPDGLCVPKTQPGAKVV